MTPFAVPFSFYPTRIFARVTRADLVYVCVTSPATTFTFTLYPLRTSYRCLTPTRDLGTVTVAYGRRRKPHSSTRLLLTRHLTAMRAHGLHRFSCVWFAPYANDTTRSAHLHLGFTVKRPLRRTPDVCTKDIYSVSFAVRSHSCTCLVCAVLHHVAVICLRHFVATAVALFYFRVYTLLARFILRCALRCVCVRSVVIPTFYHSPLFSPQATPLQGIGPRVCRACCHRGNTLQSYNLNAVPYYVATERERLAWLPATYRGISAFGDIRQRWMNGDVRTGCADRCSRAFRTPPRWTRQRRILRRLSGAGTQAVFQIQRTVRCNCICA